MVYGNVYLPDVYKETVDPVQRYNELLEQMIFNEGYMRCFVENNFSVVTEAEGEEDADKKKASRINKIITTIIEFFKAAWGKINIAIKKFLAKVNIKALDSKLNKEIQTFRKITTNNPELSDSANQELKDYLDGKYEKVVDVGRRETKLNRKSAYKSPALFVINLDDAAMTPEKLSNYSLLNVIEEIINDTTEINIDDALKDRDKFIEDVEKFLLETMGFEIICGSLFTKEILDSDEKDEIKSDFLKYCTFVSTNVKTNIKNVEMMEVISKKLSKCSSIVKGAKYTDENLKEKSDVVFPAMSEAIRNCMSTIQENMQWEMKEIGRILKDYKFAINVLTDINKSNAGFKKSYDKK